MGTIAIVVDTGPLYAYADADDRHHIACAELLQYYRGPLIVPMLVIAEAAWMIGRRLGAEVEAWFLADLASGDFWVEPVAANDWLRIAELVSGYRNLPLGTIDASVVATAERLDIHEAATLDRRDFSTVRPSHTEYFELLP